MMLSTMTKERRPSPEEEQIGPLDLGFSSSRTVN
jgi:hypothetical protein